MDPLTISLYMVLEKVASSLFDFGLSSGWNKMFKGETNIYKNKLEEILSLTIKQFQERFPLNIIDGTCPFYHSQIFLEEVLKLRLFKDNKEDSITKIQYELKTNNKIQQPSDEELDFFYQKLNENLLKDEKFKQIEINAHYKEVIFEVYNQFLIFKNEFKSINIDEIGLLKREYETQVDDLFEDIDLLRFSTALTKLEKLESRIKKNIKTYSKSLQSKIEFVRAICHSHIYENDRGKESYIKAYLINPIDLKNIEIACWVYFKQNDSSYKSLLDELTKHEPFNPYVFAINALKSDRIDEYIQQIPEFIKNNFRFQRNIFNYLISKEPNRLKEIDYIFNNLHYNIPDIISYTNLDDLIFLANLNFLRFVNSTPIDFDRPTEITDQSLYLFNLLDKLNTVIKRSELGQFYEQVCLTYTWLKSELYFDQVTIDELLVVSKQLNKSDKMLGLFIANSLQKRHDTANALEVINKYEDDEQFLSLKIFCQPDFETTKKATQNYLNIIQVVDQQNISNICALIEPILKKEIYSREEIISIVNSKKCNDKNFNKLIILLIETFSKKTEIKIEEVLKVKKGLSEQSYLNIFIVILMYENQFYHECIEFTLPQINDNEKPNFGILKLLIKAINKIRIEHQEKLVGLLKLWRENFGADTQFLSMEIEIQTHLQNWSEIKKINEFALNALPKNEFFFTSYIDSLARNNDFIILTNMIDEIINFDFEFTDNAIYISDLLIKNEYVVEGFDLLYRYAKEKINIKARWHFFQLSLEFQENNIFRDYEIVQPDCYVNILTDGNSQIKYIQKDIKKLDDIGKNLLNRAVGESFVIIKKISGKIISITIERITNKYLSLLLEIHEEFKSPVSEYPVEMINFNKNDINSLKQELVNIFGAKNDQNKLILQNNLDEYYHNYLAFSGITLANFQNDQISTYYTLTSNQANGFLVNPQKLDLRDLDTENATFVLDFTSGLLLFELSKSFNISYNQKFIIGQSLIRHIDTLVYQTKTNTSKLSMDIMGDSIIPFLKPADFDTNRINFLKEIKQWFINNCTVEIPIEKINYTMELHKQNQYEKEMDFILETSLLGNRPNHYLISDDLVFTQFLKMSAKQISTDHFLFKIYPEQRKNIFRHLLKNRYVGINFDSNDLYDCFIEKNYEDKSHVYEFCLRNLELFYSYNPQGCNSIILHFLKQIATNPIYNNEIFENEARQIFTRCFKIEISKTIIDDLILKTIKLFKLLPSYFDAIKVAIDDSVEITQIVNTKNM